MEVVKQEGKKDCGVCSLLSVIKHYEGYASLEYLRELTSTTKNGVTAYNLVEAAKTMGFNSYGLKLDLDDLKKDMLPIISHIIVNKSYQHFIVIYEKNDLKKYLIVMDPAIGKRKISFSEFNLMTSKNYIYLKPVKKILKIETKKIINDIIKDFIRKNKKYIPHILILTIIYFLLSIMVVNYFKILLNKAIIYSIKENVYLITKLIIILYIYKEITNYIKNIIILKLNNMLDEVLIKKTLDRLTLLPYLYYKNRTSGEIISRFKDIEVIKNFITKLVSTLIIDSVILIIFLYFLFMISKILMFLILILSLILILKEIIISKHYIKRKNSYLKEEDKINGSLYEYINSMLTIKSLHEEKEKLNSFIHEYKYFIEKSYVVNRILLILSSLNNILINFHNIALYSIGSILIINNKLTISSLIVFGNILSFYLTSITNLLELYKDYHEYSLSKKRIEELFTISKENFNCLEYFNDYKLVGTIKIKNLYYQVAGYDILKGINLKIKNKDKIFLTGKSGSGKSTLMKILARFISINYGRISIGAIDLNHYHLNTIRSRLIYVSQNESLFTGSIKENITFNKDDENLLEKVIKITNTDRLLDSEVGYNRIIEENGSNISGGERQKIILARTLMKERDIYIFDEALNQIDIEQEKEILTNILNFLKDKTVIFISHRTTSIDLFNRVLELKDGKIYEKL